MNNDESNNPPKEIYFINNAAIREFKELPEEHAISFGLALKQVAYGEDPSLDKDHLASVGAGVIELKINGRPAYRCVYYNKLPGKVVVLHTAKKTTNGPDKKIVETARKRLSSLK